jgi:SAM-dependent methyltransferase
MSGNAPKNPLPDSRSNPPGPSPEPTRRFSNRVEDYIRYRPHYPREILDFLATDCGLTLESVIGDIGSGTGIFSELFLANGHRLFGIEPNREMREAGERLLRHFERFTSCAGTAEATSLPDQSVDFVTAGQAFHWFNRDRCRPEFCRVLRPSDWVVLTWNERRTDSTPFLAEYEQLLLEFATDYAKVDHRQIDGAALTGFFGVEPRRRSWRHYQEFDYEGLKGRLLSSSYAPARGQPRHEEMIGALKSLFDRRQESGRVKFEYEAIVFCCPRRSMRA